MKTDIKSKTKACAMCAHWNPTSKNKGECRRHAPQSVVFKVDGDVKFDSKFPMTAGSDWCGDFKAAAKGKAK